MVPAWLYGVARSAAQVLVGLVVARLAAAGVSIPLEAQNWLVETVLVTLALTLWVALVRWLETRRGNGFWPWFARQVAKVLMLGLKRQPVYPDRTPVYRHEPIRPGVPRV